MADEITKVDDDNIKIVSAERKEKVVSITSLLKEKAALSAHSLRFEAQVLDDRAKITNRLGQINALLAQAASLGITIPS
jgi:hypothetical protein